MQNLFSFPKQESNSLFLYRASGSQLYYSTQGTGNWTIAAGSAGGDIGGTITNGNYVGHAILNNVLIVGDGAGSTRHTTNGTQFSNTTLAPVAQYLAQYHNRIYATDGTSSVITYSSYGSADNWSIAIPADSSSFVVPEAGACSKPFIAGDRLIIPKNRGRMFNWDDYALTDMSTVYGPSSPWSIDRIDDYSMYVNQVGHFGFDGANKQLLSNPIQRQFYNRAATGIGASSWGTAPAGVYIWDYLAAVGTITDDFTGRQIPNAIIKYDYQKNQYMDWSFANAPTAFHSFIDAGTARQLIFADTTGQCYKLDPTLTSDNGAPIATEMVFLFTYASQSSTFTPSAAQTIFGSSYEKVWRWLRLFFNPGCEVNIQFAFSNSYTYQHLRWSEVINIKPNANGEYWQESDGVVEIRFPRNDINPPRSRFLFLRIYDYSTTSQYTYHGCQIDAAVQPIQ